MSNIAGVITIQQHTSISHILPDLNQDNYQTPLVQYFSYLYALENAAGRNFEPVYITFSENDKIRAIAYFQIVHFKGKELNSFLNEPEQKKGFSVCLRQAFGNLLIGKVEEMELNLMASGNLFITGDKGFYCAKDITSIEKESISRQVIDYIKNRVMDAMEVGTLLIRDFYSEDDGFDFLKNIGFVGFPTEPDMMMSLPAHWSDFQEYTEALSSKYRVKLKKIMEQSERVTLRKLSAEEVSEQAHKLWQLYENVANHSNFNLSYLPTSYFSDTQKFYGDRFQVYGYYFEEKLIGFSSVFICHEKNTLEDHYIGLDYENTSDVNLYHRMLFDFIKIALEHHLQHIHYGRTATEIKSSVGAVPLEMKAYIYHSSKLKNFFLAPITRNVKAKEYIIRNPFKQTAIEAKTMEVVVNE
ncbi:MAG: peptidogalycan biosysnthesis protein [Chitinophagales bacterium]|nr:peptidogalycan biosysnthesis protein [Chitinophagales bacterium]